MLRPSIRSVILKIVLVVCMLSSWLYSFQLIDQISSEHVVMRMPQARESLGRDSIEEIERCYAFMNRTIGGNLPRKILINVVWDQPESGCNRNDLSITIGMNRPDKVLDLKTLLLHKVEREIARLGLLELSDWAQREDTEFLFEGMIEILVHEFSHSSRSLESAWTYSRMLDEMKMLGFNNQRSWSVFSGGKRSHRNAAPGVTFLTTFRELLGRERPIKLFEALKRTSLSVSLKNTFKAPITELENTWLQKVRAYQPVDEITLFPEDAPHLLEAVMTPETSPAGGEFRIRLLLSDRNEDLLADGVFVRDQRTQRVLQAHASPENDREYISATIPVEATCPPGQYNCEIIAIDEAGNLRRWVKTYVVGSR